MSSNVKGKIKVLNNTQVGNYTLPTTSSTGNLTSTNGSTVTISPTSQVLTADSAKYHPRTASQSGTTITAGSGSTFTNTMVNGIIFWGAGTSLTYIVGFIDSTHLVAATSQTVGLGAAVIYDATAVTVPSNAINPRATIYGGGASGGNGTKQIAGSVTTNGSGSAGSGAAVLFNFPLVAGNTYYVTCGLGGPTTTTQGTNGVNGDPSSIRFNSTLIKVSGGNAGLGSNTAGATIGPSGPITTYGGVAFAGGNGGQGSNSAAMNGTSAVFGTAGLGNNFTASFGGNTTFNYWSGGGGSYGQGGRGFGGNVPTFGGGGAAGTTDAQSGANGGAQFSWLF